MNIPNYQFQWTFNELSSYAIRLHDSVTKGNFYMAITAISSEPCMIFGDSLMRNYFIAFDKSRNRVGFSAPESQNRIEKAKNLLH